MMTTTIFPPFDAEKTFPLVVHGYVISNQIGEGDQARVYSVCDASSGRSYALKVFDFDFTGCAAKTRIRQPR